MSIRDLLSATLDQEASDLHLSPGQVAKVRIDGDIVDLNEEVLESDDIAEIFKEITTSHQQQQFSKNLELDFSFALAAKSRFRVNAYMTNIGIALAFRPIPNRIPTLEQIQAPKILRILTEAPRGLILVTGPTGSGKSTTLAAMINHINHNRRMHILTIEDPVEFEHQSDFSLVNQRELNQSTLSFENALRAAMREDPDIILIGEMRDLETIRLALTAAETGHLVFATLHTTGAAKTIDRVVGVFPGPEKDLIRIMLSESLLAVVSQILVKKASGHGRVAAREIMLNSPAIRNLIRENKIAQMQSAIQTSAAQGMISLDQSLSRLVEEGLISGKEAEGNGAAYATSSGSKTRGGENG